MFWILVAVIVTTLLLIQILAMTMKVSFQAVALVVAVVLACQALWHWVN